MKKKRKDGNQRKFYTNVHRKDGLGVEFIAIVKAN